MLNPLRRVLLALAFLVPVWAQAQVLDFDSVCATPPCAAGSLYSASGIAITPASTNVVAAGTNGLTGVNGGKYLSIAAFPYQVSFGLSRNATFFSASLSRASTSSGTVTVAVTALRAGVVVAGPTNVVLTTVNTWSPVSFSVGAGIDQIFLDPSGGANLTFGIDNVQLAGNCYGFSDVLPGDSFCNAAEWLGNRGVTTGCAAGLYCPTANVTRAAMALFMNRLGNALTPVFYQSFGGSGTLLPGPIYLCPTGDIAVGSSPKTATVDALVNLYANGLNGSVDVVGNAVYSLDGGTTWQVFGFNFYQTLYVGASPVNDITFPVQATLNLAPGQTYRLGVALSRFSGTGTNPNPFCTLRATVFNRISSSAPFDEAPADRGQPGR